MPVFSALSLFSAFANAELIEYRYVAPNNVDSHRQVTNPQYINSKANLSILASGGLDRTITLNVIKGSKTIYTKRSKRIGVNDRHVSGKGESYYGILFDDIPTLSDGQYTITETLNALDGSLLNESSAILHIDTIPPTVSDNIEHGGDYNRTAHDGKPVWSSVHHRFIRLNNVADDNTGIAKASFVATAKDGQRSGEVIRTGDMKYFPVDSIAQIGNGSMGTSSWAVPHYYQGRVDYRFILEDRAGNETTKTLHVYINSDCPTKPVLVAYQDPSYSGSFMGQPNMRPLGQDIVIRSNPTRLLYKLPKDQYHRFPEGKIYGGWPVGLSEQYITESGRYAYFAINDIPILMNGLADWPARGWTNSSTWRCNGMGVADQGYNFSFAPDAKAPTTKNIEAYINGYGWVGKDFGFKTSLDVPLDTKISKIRATGEPRGYAQTFTIYGQTCEIPTGSTQCTVNVALDYNKKGTANYYHNWNGIAKKGVPSLYHRIGYTWEWDADLPIFAGGIKHDDRNKSVDFNVISRFSGSTWNRVRLENAGLKIINRSTGAELIINGSLKTQGDNSIVTADYSTLSDSGDYSISAFATDLYGNQMLQHLFDTGIDGTPPVISLSVNQQEFEQGQLVLGLESLSFQLADASAVSVKSIQLKGGPTADHVFLAWSRLNGSNANAYVLEYPRLFPSLEPDEIYHLEITAEDYFGNETTEEFEFTYLPNNLIRMKTVDVLPVPENLLDVNNKPLIYIESNELRTDEGELAKGLQDIIFTVRKDADISLTVNEQVIQAGESKTVQVPINNDRGVLKIPVYPSDNAEGSAKFLFEIFEIKSTL
ncbi:Ig-like domain-containing protein [Photobacterium angustum]|uniref:Ig-like domain-containing protein n=1 Tax=Photobacterium angustum TaxID=661 RepID=UPI001364C924|nr:Ig-like domain-containing protein [Photobacterium angustum]